MQSPSYHDRGHSVSWWMVCTIIGLQGSVCGHEGTLQALAGQHWHAELWQLCQKWFGALKSALPGPPVCLPSI